METYYSSFPEGYMGIYDFTIYDMIDRNAKCFHKRNAWIEVDDGRTLTFQQVKDNVDCLATGLQQFGVKRGDRIGVLGKNSLEYFLLYGAAAALGAIMLPVNWRLSPEEVCFNLNDCAPKVVFVDKDFQSIIQRLKDRLTSVEKYFALGRDNDELSDFDSLMGNQGNFEQPDVSSDDGFVIIHTAAVNGSPRGALLSHNNVLLAGMNLSYFLKLTPQDVGLSVLPLFHIAGLFSTMLVFQTGALNVNISKFDASKVTKLIEERKVSVMYEFSPMLSQILDNQEKTGAEITSLKTVIGLDTKETIEKYQIVTGGYFCCGYGQTETSSLCSCCLYNERPGSAGRMLPLVKTMIVNTSDRPVPVGQTGEMVIRGPLVFKGYWNCPDDNAQTFRNGWLHTGDLGRFDEDGFLWYESRKADKELIKPGGENVYPAEVEKVILEHPDVERVVVFGVPDPKWKEGIKAVCQLKAGRVLEPQVIIDFVGERIARFKKPQYVEFVSDFPLSEDESPDRDKIKKIYGGPQYNINGRE